MEPKKRIFDNRKKDKFQVDDEYLNGYAKLCGWKATLSYISLCRHANRDQYCFPKIEDMAKQHHVSRKIIMEGIKILEDWNIIQVIKKRRNDGAFRNNAYILLDKSEWKPKPPSENNDQVSNGDMDEEDDQVPNSDSDEEPPTSPIDTPPSNPQEPHQVSNGDCKETHGKESHSKEVISNDITDENKILSIFYEINPTINFGNKTQRAAIARLYNRFGEEKTIALANAAIKIYGVAYAPTITTPIELERNLSKLIAYYKRNNTNTTTFRNYDDLKTPDVLNNP